MDLRFRDPHLKLKIRGLHLKDLNLRLPNIRNLKLKSLGLRTHNLKDLSPKNLALNLKTLSLNQPNRIALNPQHLSLRVLRRKEHNLKAPHLRRANLPFFQGGFHKALPWRYPSALSYICISIHGLITVYIAIDRKFRYPLPKARNFPSIDEELSHNQTSCATMQH
jgi:hypothetical protein